MSSFVSGLIALQNLGSKVLNWHWISNNLTDEIIPAVIGHIYLSFVSVTIALLISLPTGIVVSRYRKAGYGLFGRHPRYYADRGDALRFEKPLMRRARGARATGFAPRRMAPTLPSSGGRNTSRSSRR